MTQSNNTRNGCASASSPKLYVTNVLIIGAILSSLSQSDYCLGNGPSGLALSAILSGYRPYFDVTKRHPDEQLDAKLRRNADTSLLEQDLIGDASFDHSSNVGRYIDALERPQADFDPSLESVLVWKRQADARVQHLCVSHNDAGGGWNEFPSLVGSYRRM